MRSNTSRHFQAHSLKAVDLKTVDAMENAAADVVAIKEVAVVEIVAVAVANAAEMIAAVDLVPAALPEKFKQVLKADVLLVDHAQKVADAGQDLKAEEDLVQ